jgi:predicted lipoprotein with Yx(FWY)xxD motif
MRRISALALALIVALLFSGLVPTAAQDAATAVVQLGGNKDLGKFLVDSKGMTLYLYTKDTPGVSNCYDQCAVNWPPLIVDANAKLTAGDGVPGKLDTTARKDGSLQVTYNNWPLYYWIKDKAVGDATGQNVGKVWFVIAPETVLLGNNKDLGSFFVDAKGMTLYIYTKDTPGVSNCYDQCAVNWPPLTVDKGVKPTAGIGVDGLDTIERKDGTLQVTYDKQPLYFYIKDKAAGDATGQDVGSVWFVVKPEVVSVGENADLGKILVGWNGLTLYTFTNDKPGVSSCVAQCAVNWPPLTVVKGEQIRASEGVTGKLGIIERADGTYQVTYNDQPLYFYIKDKFPGQATGQSVGDVWFVIKAGGM